MQALKSERKEGHWQAQPLDARRGLLSLGPALERPYTHPRALAILGIDHLCIGFDPGSFKLLAYFTHLVGFGKSTNLHNETFAIGPRRRDGRLGGAPLQ